MLELGRSRKEQGLRHVGQIWRKSGLVGSVTQEITCPVKVFQFSSLISDSHGLCCSCGQQWLQHPRRVRDDGQRGRVWLRLAGQTGWATQLPERRIQLPQRRHPPQESAELRGQAVHPRGVLPGCRGQLQSWGVQLPQRGVPGAHRGQRWQRRHQCQDGALPARRSAQLWEPGLRHPAAGWAPRRCVQQP